jgi:hypothetical protein
MAWAASDQGLEHAAEVAVVGKSHGRRHIRERLIGISERVASRPDAQLVKVFADGLTETTSEGTGEVNRVDVESPCDLENRHRLGKLRAEKIDAGGKPARLPALGHAVVTVETTDELPESAVDHLGPQCLLRMEPIEPGCKTRKITREQPWFEIGMGGQDIGRGVEPLGPNLDEKKHGAPATDAIAVRNRGMEAHRERTVFELPPFDLLEIGAAWDETEIGGRMAVSGEPTLTLVGHLRDDGRREVLLPPDSAKVFANLEQGAHLLILRCPDAALAASKAGNRLFTFNKAPAHLAATDWRRRSIAPRQESSRPQAT